MPGLSDLEGTALAKVLRRTVVSALIAGGGAIIVALCLSEPLAAVGIVLGLGMAVLNFRFLDAGVAKMQTKGETDRKVLRRAMGTKTVTRLGVITVIAVGLLFLNGPLGIGSVVGLVIFQIFFVLNVGRTVLASGHPMIARLAGGSITIGDHRGVVHIPGLGTVDLDVIWTSALAAIVIITLGYMMKRKVTSGVPSRLQLFWETITEQVTDLTDSAIGPAGRKFVGLGVTIFFFILLCNWIAFIPTGEPGWLPPPTSDVNLPLAMAVAVVALLHYQSIKARGLKKYLQALHPALCRHDPDQRH